MTTKTAEELFRLRTKLRDLLRREENIVRGYCVMLDQHTCTAKDLVTFYETREEITAKINGIIAELRVCHEQV